MSASPQVNRELIEQCDELIKGGKVPQVLDLLKQTSLLEPPRPLAQSLAQICRRVGLVQDGLRIMTPIVRKKIYGDPTNLEIAEHAVLLSRAGSIDEAFALLSQLDSVSEPEILYHLACCYVFRWEYKEADATFRKYLAVTDDPYRRLICKVNIASGLLTTSQYKEALNEVGECIEIAHKMNAQRLLGNCYEIGAQARILDGDFASGLKDLDKAEAILKTVGGFDLLFAFKWRCVAEALGKQDVAPLDELRKRAREQRHWDSLREADLFSVKIAFSQEIFDRLYYCSPIEGYRQHIKRNLAHEPSATYNYGPGDMPTVDLSTGKSVQKYASLLGQKVLGLIEAMGSDFYAPLSVNFIFSKVYPDQYFDIFSSIQRVQQLVSRTRKIVEDHNLGLNLLSTENGYRLRFNDIGCIRYGLAAPKAELEDARLATLRKVFTDRWFSMAEATEAMGVSKSTAKRLVAQMVSDGQIENDSSRKPPLYRCS